MSAALPKLDALSICEIRDKKWRISLSIGIRPTVIRWVVCLLRIFKMFHGLMNNPVWFPIAVAGRNMVNHWLRLNLILSTCTVGIFYFVSAYRILCSFYKPSFDSFNYNYSFVIAVSLRGKWTTVMHGDHFVAMLIMSESHEGNLHDLLTCHDSRG